jgi:hypothetical protein
MIVCIPNNNEDTFEVQQNVPPYYCRNIGEYFAFVCSLVFECESHGVFTFFCERRGKTKALNPIKKPRSPICEVCCFNQGAR